MIGTTGWAAQRSGGARDRRRRGHRRRRGAELRARRQPVRRAGRTRGRGCCSRSREFGACIHEAHHAAKRDAPSGTRSAARDGMRERGYNAPIDISSTRAGFIPGTHTIGFDAAGGDNHVDAHRPRSIRLCPRRARGRALGAGRSGWFTMRDVLGFRMRLATRLGPHGDAISERCGLRRRLATAVGQRCDAKRAISD